MLSFAFTTRVVSRPSANILLVAVEESAAGMATAIEEVRTLTAGGAESKQLRQLAEMESKYQMREAETQLKLVIVETLEGLLQTQLSGQPRTAAEGSSAQLQALMTKYCVAWSTLPYCDHDELVDRTGNEDDPSV